jgi:hypothetical protein
LPLPTPLLLHQVLVLLVPKSAPQAIDQTDLPI